MTLSVFNKSIWAKPELIVLVRHKPEEAVLTTCKTQGSEGPGISGCRLRPPTGGGQPGPCELQSPS